MTHADQAVELARGRHTAFLNQYAEMLRIPSVSTLPEHRADMRRMADWCAEELRRLGMTRVEINETPGHPIVYAEWLNAPGKPTVLVYGHYDVQPVDPIDEWESDPFGAEVRGEWIFARGASDMKGQIFAQMKAMECLRDVDGAYPVNIKYLLEGEEEIGSLHLPPFIDTHKEQLACDVTLNCDAGVYSPEIPGIVYALRGLAYFEIEVRSAGHDLHSGLFGGSVRNPIHVLAELIAGMHDAKGRVTLPGFYDRVRPLDEEERELLAQMPWSEQEWLGMTGASALHGEEGYTTHERVGARPTLDINGIWGGFTGEGAKTVLPARAWAKLSTRLVPDQRHGEIEGMLRAHLEAHAPKNVEWTLKVHSLGPGAVMDRKSSYMQSAAAALEDVFGRPPLFHREGGSVPVVGLFQEKLGVDSIMLGFALPGDGIHGPNEHQHLPTLFKGVEAYIRFLCRLGG